MGDTERRLKLARAQQTELQTARDEAAGRLADLRERAGLEHLTLDELARGEVPTVSAAAEALRELERRCREQSETVQSLAADLRNEQAREASSVYLAKLATFMEALDSIDEDLSELMQMRAELAQLQPFATAPSAARLVASIAELRTQYDVARGARHSLTSAEPTVSMVLVDGQSVPRAEWEAQPKTVSKGEAIAAFFKGTAGRAGQK